jgi:lipopolysaccharide export system permease protein
MKRAHRLLVGAFVGPLWVTFLIVLFILSMQFVWKYVDDLMGKGLEWYVVAELLAYATASFVPLAIPLAVLLSSIMVMGGLAEQSELVALRSAGLPLWRIIAPLFLFVVCISCFSFFFSNTLMPIANLKFQSLLWDVTRKKPALNLQPNVFYDGIEGLTIRVRDKDPDTGDLTDVLIYDHRSKTPGNSTVVRAAAGKMQRSTDGGELLLTLHNGVFYDERSPSGDVSGTAPLLRGRFVEDVIRLDLRSLGLDRTDEDLFKGNQKMLNMRQLLHLHDSLLKDGVARQQQQERYLRSLLFTTRDPGPARASKIPATQASPPREAASLATFNAYDFAMDLARSTTSFMDRSRGEREERDRQLARAGIEIHRKPMLALACLVFFFIGAPLGAIIRKGGMGLPTVIAILFFLVFHIISFSTEKLVLHGHMQAWPGMWISTLVLLPVGAFLTYKAATDSPLFDRDAYARLWDRALKLLGCGPLART